MVQGSPVTASQLASIVQHNTRPGSSRSLAASLASLDVSSTAMDWRGLQTLLQNFPRLRRLEAEEQHWQGLLVSLGDESLACRDCLPANLPLRAINLARHTYSLLEPLARSLPNLEHLSLGNYERSEAYLDGEDQLPRLGGFPRLSSLALQDVDMEEMFHYLQQSATGRNIKTFRYTLIPPHTPSRSLHTLLQLHQPPPPPRPRQAGRLVPQPAGAQRGRQRRQVHYLHNIYLHIIFTISTRYLRSIDTISTLSRYWPDTEQAAATLPALTQLCLQDVTMEGDQACWKRLVGMTKCINLDTIDRTQDLILKKKIFVFRSRERRSCGG